MEDPPEGTIAVFKAPDNSFVKYILIRGENLYCPKEGSICLIKILPKCDIECFRNNLIIYSLNEVIEVQLGEGDSQIDILFDKCIETMKLKEKCLVKCMICKEESKWMMEDKNEMILVEFEVELLSYTEVKDLYQITASEKFTKAKYHKNKGSEWFRQDKILWAFRRFSKAIKYILLIHSNNGLSNCMQEEVNELKAICYLNLSACHIKSRNYSLAAVNCSKALELDSNNVKALFRRGLAYTELQEYEKAQNDLRKAANLEPGNKSILQQMDILNNRIKVLNQTYAQAMKKLFK